MAGRRQLQRQHDLYVETFLAAAYPVGAGRAVVIVPLEDVTLPAVDAAQSIDELTRKLPAHAIVKLLRYASTQPWYPLFEGSLPVAGLDGSLADRLRNSDAQGHVFGKTGSLGHVNTLSGYAETKKGDKVVFSIMGNNHDLHGRRALDAIDEIMETIIADTPAAKK